MSGLFCSPASPVVRPLPLLEAPLLDAPLLLPPVPLLDPLPPPLLPEAPLLLEPPATEPPLLLAPAPLLEVAAPLLLLPPPLLWSDPSPPNPPVEGVELQARRKSTSEAAPTKRIVMGADRFSGLGLKRGLIVITPSPKGVWRTLALNDELAISNAE